MEQLKGMEDEEDLDQATRLAVFKLKTTIIEKIINLRERVLNFKRIANLEAVVISVLDDLVKDEDRETLLDRIAPYREDVACRFRLEERSRGKESVSTCRSRWKP